MRRIKDFPEESVDDAKRARQPQMIVDMNLVGSSFGNVTGDASGDSYILMDLLLSANNPNFARYRWRSKGR